jgi:hypothetical protein
VSDSEVIELVAIATTTSEAIGRRDVGVRLTALLSDGREVSLLHDRGFAMSASQAVEPLPDPDDDDLFICAWCVGPEEKFDDRTDKDMAEAHFGVLVDELRLAGVHVTVEALMSVPFRVVWGARQRRWPESLEWY